MTGRFKPRDAWRMRFQNCREIISLWPSKPAMQAALKRRGKTADVEGWYDRNAIPIRWFDAVVKAAGDAGFEGVTYAELTFLFKQRSKRTNP